LRISDRVDAPAIARHDLARVTTIAGILYVEGFLDRADEVLEWAIARVEWDERIKARKTASYGIPYDYAGLTYEARAFPPELEFVMLLVSDSF
jgi:hypothetical protein